MGTISTNTDTRNSETGYNRLKELKDFDDSKMGVKGLVDSGAEKIPRMFVRPSDELSEDQNTLKNSVKLELPVIDFAGIGSKESYDKIVKQIIDASEKWGFFQVVNHGIPVEILDKMIAGVRMFHEQDAEIKKTFYSRDQTKQVLYSSNYDLYKTRAANWRDTFVVRAQYCDLDPEEVPELCRDVVLDYINHVLKLGEILLELLSVGLGLRPGYLGELDCSKGWSSVNHYYPPCPEPELTMGTSKHTDPSFFTVLLQDQIGGLQVFHESKWVDVQPMHGALVVNIGDLLQILSNDRLKSVYHRVTANLVGPRISAAFFFTGSSSSPVLYGPIKELVSEEKPAIFREFTLGEFNTQFFNRPLYQPGIDQFKVQADSVGK